MMDSCEINNNLSIQCYNFVGNITFFLFIYYFFFFWGMSKAKDIHNNIS